MRTKVPIKVIVKVIVKVKIKFAELNKDYSIKRAK